MTNLSIKCLKSETIESGACYGQFLIDSLQVGQGITIGNQLRRVLLADLSGIAISAVRIAGVTHEFSTLPGIREDILEILLNLKGIVFRSTTKSPPSEVGRLKIYGPIVVTADLLELPPSLEIVNPTHYIATIAETNLLEIEFKFESGTGYRLASEALYAKNESYLPLDTIFMPVHKVNFKIETIYDAYDRVSERLWIEIWTNGSLSPAEALTAASQTIVDVFTSLLEMETVPETPPANVTHPLGSLEPYTNIMIEELHLSVRAYNCLKKAQINTIGDLLQYSPQKLQELKNFGRKSANEVFSTLKNKLNISLK